MKSKENEPPVCAYFGEVRLTDGKLVSGVEINEIYGKVTDISGQIIGKTHSVRGTIQLSRMQFEGKSLSDVSAHFLQKSGRLSLDDIVATAYKGRLKGWMLVNSADTRCEGEFELAGLDLAAFSQDTFIAGKEVQGQLNGKLGLSWQGKDMKTVKGSGSLSISDGVLWDVPVFLGILTAFDLLGKKSSVFSEGQVAFTLADEQLHVNKMKFSSEDISLEGDGKIGFDGKLDLSLKTSMTPSIIPKIIPLGEFFGALGKMLYDIKADGTFKDPKVSVRVMPPLHDIFKKDK
jgi:uncharacterized protein involved in outer membrane biogenesis